MNCLTFIIQYLTLCSYTVTTLRPAQDPKNILNPLNPLSIWKCYHPPCAVERHSTATLSKQHSAQHVYVQANSILLLSFYTSSKIAPDNCGCKRRNNPKTRLDNRVCSHNGNTMLQLLHHELSATAATAKRSLTSPSNNSLHQSSTTISSGLFLGPTEKSS